MDTLKTILHPTDFSDLSKKVMHAAVARAKAAGASLIILHVREPQETIEGEFGMPPPEPEPTDEQILSDLQAIAPVDASVKIDVMIARGVVAEEIVSVAKLRHCDLVMLASHGHTGLLSRLFHANVADQVRREAGCPVLVMTEEDAPQPATV